MIAEHDAARDEIRLLRVVVDGQVQGEVRVLENIEDTKVRGVDPPSVFVEKILILSYSR